MGEAPRDAELIPALTAEVDGLRERTQSIVTELERRLRQRLQQGRATLGWVRHAVDLRAHWQQHPAWVISAGAAASALLGVGVYVAVVRTRRARRPTQRLRRRLDAYRALLSAPERGLRREPPLGKRLLSALLIAGVTTLVRNLGTLLLERGAPRRRLPA
jgi:hypothetical protein